MKQGLWCIEGCTTVCQSTDIKTLAWSQAFGSWSIVQLSNSSQTSKTWREIRFLVHGRSYNSLTATWHQNPGLEPGLWCTEDCITVWHLPDIKILAWSQVFGTWKIVQLSDSSPTSKPRLKMHGRLYNSGFIQKGKNKIPWHFPDISLTQIQISLTKTIGKTYFRLSCYLLWDNSFDSCNLGIFYVLQRHFTI